jgi:hypothetical protein
MEQNKNQRYDEDFGEPIERITEKAEQKYHDK